MHGSDFTALAMHARGDNATIVQVKVRKRSKDEFRQTENAVQSQGQPSDAGNCMLRIKIDKNRNKEIIRG